MTFDLKLFSANESGVQLTCTNYVKHESLEKERKNITDIVKVVP
jgi:hypothetical protein